MWRKLQVWKYNKVLTSKVMKYVWDDNQKIILFNKCVGAKN